MDSKNHRAVEANYGVSDNKFYQPHRGAPSPAVNLNTCQDHRGETFWNTSSGHSDSNEPLSQQVSLPWKGPHPVVIRRGPLGFGFTLRQFVVHPPQSIRDDSSDVAEYIEGDQDKFLSDRDTSYQDQGSILHRQQSIEPLESIFVKTVKENSPAELSGLHTGDQLVAINGDSITGKPYHQIIETLHNCGPVLKLLVVPKDEDILQLAYAFLSEDSCCPYTDLNPDKKEYSRLKEHSQFHSQSSLSFDKVQERHKSRDTVMEHNDARYSFPLSGMESQEIDYRLGSSAENQPCRVSNTVHQIKRDYTRDSNPGIQMYSQEPNFTTTCSLPSKSKYSFGLYFPPKSSAPSTARKSNTYMGSSHTDRGESSKTPASNVRRKSSFDETSVLSASAKSRDYFIRYSTEKAASDNRNRYSPRHSAYDRYPSESHPESYMCRSQTMSHIPPTKLSGQPVSQTTVQISGGSLRAAPLIAEAKPSGSSDHKLVNQCVVRIPYEQQPSTVTGNQPQSVMLPLVRQNYGTTFALTRSPTATHIEISKSIGKPIVSQRKYQFEIAATSDQPVSSALNQNTGANRYQSEIEKIRTQPKFSSIAMRKASFEQSPDRDPPGFDDQEEPSTGERQDFQASKVESAQPTIKVRKISAEHNLSAAPSPTLDMQGKERQGSNIRIYVSPGNLPHKSSPIVEIGIDSYNSQGLRSQPSAKRVQLHSSDNTLLQVATSNAPPSPTFSKDSTYKGSSSGGSRGSLGGDSVTGLADSGVWVKSYHSSSSTDMLDGISNCGTDSTSSSYLPGATKVVMSGDSNNKVLDQENQSRLGAGWSPWKTSYISNVHESASTEMVSNQSSKIGTQQAEGRNYGEVPHFPPPVDSDVNVTMRKKIQESLEDQANKLHRRTSYLMATARDRTNSVPIEQAFSSPQVLTEISHIQSVGPTRHPSSVKLNKFFGEMIPSIAEGVEIVKSSEGEEMPEIIRKGPLSCKISVIEGKKCSDRSWKPVFAVLRPNELFLTREKDNPATSGFEDQHISLRSIMVEFARDYAKKKKHVFRMSTHNECEYLFQTEDRGTMLCWIQAIKSINEPEKAGEMEEMIASEQDKVQAAPVVVIPSHKMSPQIGGHKGRKLSALSLKAKLSSSPSMRRKKSSVIEKDESIKKTWMGRISMMKNLKKHSEDSNSISLTEQDGEAEKMQFGVRLENCFPSPHNQYVPLIVELCTRIVEARGLEVIGVYRVPGNSAAINALTEEFNRGIDAVNIDNEKLLDINVISSLLKSFFRKLEDPLVPSEHYENFIEANRHPDESKRKLKIKRLLHLLPPHHHETFKHMAEHLNKVASYGNINKMDAKNLAIMFGPTLVRKKEDDTVSLVTDMSDQCRIVESIILHHDWFFSTWDQDNYIPMETTVETVNLQEGQNAYKDEDEEADSAISTKELISSIVGAASKKLRSQRQAASIDLMEGINESVDGSAKLGTGSSSFSERNIDEAIYLASFPRSELSSSSRSVSEEFLDKKGSVSGPRGAIVVPVTPMIPVSSSEDKKTKSQAGSGGSDPYFVELQYADATPPSPSLSSSTATGATSMSRYFSDESLLADVIDSNDELDDEMEIIHPSGRLPTSLSRDAIHDTLKRIGNDVSALLHTFEQKQQKERERRKREQERVEAEHRRTRLELEQEDFDEGFDRLFLAPAWKGQITGSKDKKTGNQQLSQDTNVLRTAPVPSNKMPDVVSSSYLGEHYPYDQERVRENKGSDLKGGTYSSLKPSSNVSLPPQPIPTAVLSSPKGDFVSLASRNVDPKLKLSHTESPDFLLTDLHIQESPKETMRSTHGQDFQSSPKQQFPSAGEKGLLKPISSLRHSYGRRHGSLDSLIDMIDKDKRASWASSDSEDGSDLLTSITTTFDQKLQILLNPKYKLTGAGRKVLKNDNPTSESSIKPFEASRYVDTSKSTSASHSKQTSYTMAALLDSDRSFQDPSLHRSAKSDPKIGIACRFERNDVKATSSSPKTCGSLDNPSHPSQSLKRDTPDFRFLGKSASSSSNQKDITSVVLTRPKKLDSENGGSGRGRLLRRNSSKNGKCDSVRPISKSEKIERNSNPVSQIGNDGLIHSDLESSNRGDKENLETPEQVRNRKNQHRRHTVGGAEDFEHISALTHININSNSGDNESQRNDNRSFRLGAQQNCPSAWEQLRPAVKESGPGSMQAWIQRERLRGSTPDLSNKQGKY